MYKIALIDDDNTQVEKYKIILNVYDIELIYMEYLPDYNTILDWILDNQIEFVLIDYKLETKYNFQGSELMQYINNAIPDLPCVLFTSNVTDDDLVAKEFKIDKKIFSDEQELDDFIDRVNDNITVFRKRKELALAEYCKLYEKNKNLTITANEVEKFKVFHKILTSYNYIENIPLDLEKVEGRIDVLITEIENYLKSGDSNGEK